MIPNDKPPPEEPGFTVTGHPDPYIAGDAVLDRAKSLAQQIAERVRQLTEETRESSVAPTDDHKPLPE